MTQPPQDYTRFAVTLAGMLGGAIVWGLMRLIPLAVQTMQSQ